MISNQIIKKTIDDLRAVTKVDLAVFETEGTVVAGTWDDCTSFSGAVALFSSSPAESQEVQGCHFFRVTDDDGQGYVLLARGGSEDAHVIGKVAALSLQSLMNAYRERIDRNSFIQNLLLDNLLLVDIYNRAKKLHIETEARRVVYVIELRSENDSTAMEILRGLYGANGRDFITAVDERSIVFVQELEESDDYISIERTARLISDMLSTEAMSSARIAYGTIINDIQQVSRSYKEARMALNVGSIFYAHHRIHGYNALGIGRLIYQLPENLCEMFLNEVFTGQKPESFDEETLTTISKFFENNLNVSETARQLFVHRNTLVYRLEKLQRSTGLDIRSFEDALTFQIALMVYNYMSFMKKRPEM